MQLIKTTLLIIVLLTTTLLAKSQAILKLDTFGHTALIGDIIVTKSGDIISASNDKTIRVWSSKTGKEKRKILGAIGSGAEGEIFAIALSPNEKYLAVGGYLSGEKLEDKTAIRIYNYQTGKLIKILKSHTNVVLDLAFDKQGRYLISGSGDKTAKVWDIGDNFALFDTIKFHTKQVYAVKIIQKIVRNRTNYFAITAGFDNEITLYDMQKRKIIRSDKSNYKLQYLAINESADSAKHIAVCGYGKEIRIYDFELNLIKKIKSETEPAGLNYSKDGSFLIAGTSTSPRNINIYKPKQNYSLYSSFKKHTNATVAVNFIDTNNGTKKLAVSGGGDNNEIYIWDFLANSSSPKVKQKIVGVGNVVWSVGIKGDSVAWGNILDIKQKNKNATLRKSINLKTFSIKNSKLNIQNFNRISTSNSTYSLSHSKGGEYGKSDAVLNIKQNGTIKAKIVKTSTTGYRNNCYGWYENSNSSYIISGGSHGHLKIYNKKGDEIASLIGHTGDIWSIAVEGDRLVSGSDDQTMLVWDLSKLRIRNEELIINEKFIKNSMKKYNLSREKLIKIYPILSIFVSSDDEYVAYTKEGFFTSSKGGAKYIGYHINQGANKEARYVSVDKLYDTFYRPDLVQKALNGEDLSKYAKDIDINKIISSGLAPVVSVTPTSVGNSNSSKDRLKSVLRSKKRDINLELQVCTIDDGGYNNLTLYLNRMAIDVIGKDRALRLKKQSKTRKECFTINKLISLQNGKNTIGFKATNKAGTIESNLNEIVVNYKGRSSGKPNLHILSIGIDKYRDGDLWLKYSNADATAFTKSIQKVSKPLFKNIYTYELLDKDVTKSNILKTFKKIGAKTTREDVFIFYMAGHGITDAKTGAYFYLPVDFRYKNENSVREKGISQNDFKLALSKIQAMKSLTILDTCNSGSFAEAMASRGVLQKTAINKLTRATGRATIVASSKDQVALEGYKGHGVFTYTLMEALRGKGYGTDNKITIKELALYIEDVLPDRTYEKWGYEQIPQSNISGNDFPIGVK